VRIAGVDAQASWAGEKAQADAPADSPEPAA
jgi:hypothetical protein